MNFKFILFCVASLGSLMMFYMWFTMNSSVKDSQNIEEQYSFRISSLKSEIDAEKRMMQSLRRDTKSNSDSIIDKSSLVDKMNKKGTQYDKERVKLEKETDSIRLDLDKIKKSNDEQRKQMNVEAESKLKEDNLQIENLESEIKKLQAERDELIAKQKKAANSTIIQNAVVPNKNIDNTMQGKAPKIKEAKVNKVISEKKTVSKPGEVIVKPNVESNKNQVEIHDSIKSKLEESHGGGQVESKIHNMKHENSVDIEDVKEGYFRKKSQNSNLMQGKDNAQPLFPKNQEKGINDLIQKDKDIQQPKNVFHQIKPPKNDKEPKDDFIKAGSVLKNRLKKETIHDNEKDV